jgi:hypothetical protein
MRFRLSLTIVVPILLISTSCINRGTIDTKVTDNNVTVNVGGAHIAVGYNDKDSNDKQVAELEKENADLAKQLEAVRSQLAAKDTLLTEEVKKLQEQMATLLEKSQVLTGRLLTLRQNDANLRKQLEQIQEELKRERAARKETEERAQQAREAAESEAPEVEETVWATAAIKNLTCNEITLRVMSDEGNWESFSISPKGRLTFERKGESIRVKFFSESRWIESEVADRAEVPVNYFDFDNDGELALFEDE